jgi:hypothetical protein
VRFAQTIYSAGNDLLNLINDILDISKVEAGKLELVPEDLPLRRMVEGMAMGFEPLAQQKAGLLADDRAGRAHAIHTDRQRLEQILKNLLSNASSSPSSGRVSLTVSANADGWVQFTVQDSGIGIAPDQQERSSTPSTRPTARPPQVRRHRPGPVDLARPDQLLGGTLSASNRARAAPSPEPAAQRRRRATPPAPAAGACGAAAAQYLAPPAPVPEAAPPAGPRFADDRAEPAVRRRTVLVIEDEPEFARILYAWRTTWNSAAWWR